MILYASFGVLTTKTVNAPVITAASIGKTAKIKLIAQKYPINS